jgi:hypothetical protein
MTAQLAWPGADVALVKAKAQPAINPEHACILHDSSKRSFLDARTNTQNSLYAQFS